MKELLTQPAFLLIMLIFVVLGVVPMGLAEWRRNMKFREEMQKRQDKNERARIELEHKRLEREESYRKEQFEQAERDRQIRAEAEERRLEEERTARWEAEQREERQAMANSAGAGSGGYIVVEMSEKERPLFHDLLKGFEDYAKLKGYELSFSIDSSFEGRIAFKFTVKNDGVVVGSERVRRDFRDYLKQVQDSDIERLDDLPVIISLDEHNLLVALLKNRISFLQHSYQLSQNAVKYYETLLVNTRTFPALPAPSVVVHTGGTMDSRSYNAINSSRLIQGEDNTYTDSSANINIGRSFNEKQERVALLDDVIRRLEALENKDEAIVKAVRELDKVKDEIADCPEPHTPAIKRWMEQAKQLLSTATLAAEVAEAAHKMFQTFGLS